MGAPARVSVGAVPAERPAPEPAKLLAQWMEWEKGLVSPGQTLSDLKRGGLRDLLEALVDAGTSGDTGGGPKD